jgi:hypothetical protein
MMKYSERCNAALYLLFSEFSSTQLSQMSLRLTWETPV